MLHRGGHEFKEWQEPEPDAPPDIGEYIEPEEGEDEPEIPAFCPHCEQLVEQINNILGYCSYCNRSLWRFT